MPSNIPRNDYINQPHDCEVTAPFLNINSTRMFKSVNNLTYPVNVARNIARIAAQTHFVLASDIELYPSDNIIPRFLNMIARNEDPLNKQVNKIFPLPLFEIEDDQKVPGTKTSLLALLKANKAIPFHKRVCAACHKIPKDEEWKEAVEGDQINVFVVGKRTGIFHHWEPIYIGTNAEPLYEERQSWEGKSDKMTQGYALCVLDYDFMILDNAFLVHRPGIKTYKADYDRDILAAKTSSLIKNKIHPELKILYGEKQGCSM